MDIKSININITYLEKHEKEIREKGNTWTTPRNQKPPKITWMYSCLNFVMEFVDKERWDLVASLSGNMFKLNNKSQFTQRYAVDLLPYFSKNTSIERAEEKQKLFEKELKKFTRKPSLDGEWRPLIKQIFGKDKSNHRIIRKIYHMNGELKCIINDELSRKKWRDDVGSDAIKNIRYLLQLAQMKNDRIKIYRKKNKLPTDLKTNNEDINYIYVILNKIIDNPNEIIKLQKKCAYHMRLLDNHLKAIRSDEDYHEYVRNNDLLKSFFS